MKIRLWKRRKAETEEDSTRREEELEEAHIRLRVLNALYNTVEAGNPRRAGPGTE